MLALAKRKARHFFKKARFSNSHQFWLLDCIPVWSYSWLQDFFVGGGAGLPLPGTTSDKSASFQPKIDRIWSVTIVSKNLLFCHKMPRIKYKMLWSVLHGKKMSCLWIPWGASRTTGPNRHVCTTFNEVSMLIPNVNMTLKNRSWQIEPVGYRWHPTGKFV